MGFQQAYQTWQVNDYHQWRINKSADKYQGFIQMAKSVVCLSAHIPYMKKWKILH